MDSIAQLICSPPPTHPHTHTPRVLLHGPPGTGKTTLCKALAQKAFIRSSDRYRAGVLLDINAHSLFSKWFSESGKVCAACERM